MELADTQDSKSCDRKIMRVQLPPPAQIAKEIAHIMGNLFLLIRELKTTAKCDELMARSIARDGLRGFERKRKELVGNPAPPAQINKKPLRNVRV